MADSDPPEDQQFVVEKTEEGVKFEEQQLPIDINYSKLADWLVDRKRVPADWRKRLASIQARINKLLPELPRSTNAELLSVPSQSDAYSVDYTETKKVRNVLVAANPQDRTMFGGYSGTTGNWDSVMRAYEKDLIFLGEASHILVQNTNYEIPFFRKQAGKVQQQLADLDRKEAEYRRAASASSQAFLSACKELGIQGDEIGKEVRELVRELPGILRSVVDSVSSLRDVGAALEYYRQFLTHVHTCDQAHEASFHSPEAVPQPLLQRQDGSQGARRPQTTFQAERADCKLRIFRCRGSYQSTLKGVLPCLTALREDTSAAECSDEEAAAAFAAAGLSSHPSGSTFGPDGKPGPTIDWGISTGSDTGTNSGDAPAIDWGMTSSDASGAAVASGVGIDWGTGAGTGGSATVTGESTGLVEIDWGFSTGDEGQGAERAAGTSAGIVWGIGTASGAGDDSATPTISWDIDTAGTSAEPGAAQAVVDWGIAMEGSGESTASQGQQGAGAGAGAGEGVEAEGAGTGPQIVWDFAVEESGVEREAGGSLPSAAEEGKKGALGASTQSVVETAIRELSRLRLASPRYRSQLLDDLSELRAFLRQRAAEMSREEGSPLQTQLLAAAPEGPLQELSAAGLSSLEAAVREIVAVLTCKRTTDLLLIYSSPRYAERLEETLKQKKGNEARLLGSVEDLNRKRQELRTSLSATWLKLGEVVRKTVAVKSLVEKTLSPLYSGRPVNIIGEINNQLGAAQMGSKAA